MSTKRFIVIGAGGVGTWLTAGLVRLLEWKFPGSGLIIVDGDTGDGKELILTHCSERQVPKVLEKLVTKFILGKVAFFNEVQSEHIVAIVVQLFKLVGKVNVLKLVQAWKVALSDVIAVAFDGNAISNKLGQLEKAFAKLVKLEAEVGITTTYKLGQALNIDTNWFVQETVLGSLTYSKRLKVPFKTVVVLELK